MNNFQYTSVDRIFSKLYRDLPDVIDIHEDDVLEYIGEACEYLNIPNNLEEAVSFIDVKDYHAPLPKHLHLIIQIAKYNGSLGKEFKECCNEIKKNNINKSDNYVLGCDEPIESKPSVMNGLSQKYIEWMQSDFYKRGFEPIRLSNHTFFNSVVCRDDETKNIYRKPYCHEEYTIVGSINRKLRFSFRDGVIAISYYRNMIDPETGYPLIPDNIRHINAITYYIKWKIAERLNWSGREGFGRLAEENYQLWDKYVGQANNYTAMPKTIDDYQDILDESNSLLPNFKRYNKFFGNLK